MKRTLFVISFYLAILMSAGQLYASVTVNIEEYIPLHVGNTWTLVDEFNTTHLNQTVGRECLGTTSTYKYIRSDDLPDYYNLTYANGALLIAGINGTPLNPPRIWNGQDIVYLGGRTVFERSSSPVVTPAGVFNDVIKLTDYDKVGAQEFVTSIQYHAKGVGLVKHEDWCASCGGTYQYTALLTAYNIAGASGTDLITCIFPETGTTLVPVYSLLLDR